MKFSARTAWAGGEGETSPLAVEMIFFRIFPVPLQDPSVCRQAKVDKFFYNEFAT